MVGSGPKSSVGLRFSGGGVRAKKFKIVVLSGGWAKGPKVYSVSICCFFGAQGSFRSTLDGSFPVFPGFLGLLFKYWTLNFSLTKKWFMILCVLGVLLGTPCVLCKVRAPF